MPQDQQSGAAAAEWGRKTARSIAEQLGAKPVDSVSNEFILQREHIVIKCAKPATNNVGVTFNMLDRVSRVFGAFQQDDGNFDIWSLPASVFTERMRDGKSRGSKPNLGHVNRSAFAELGTHVATLRLP